MKKLATICIIFCGLIFGTTACDDFLSQESPDQLTSDNFWRDQKDAEAGLAAAYSQLEYSIGTWGFAEVKWPVEAYRQDDVNLGNDAMNYPNWVELSTFTNTNGNSQVSSYWVNNYRGISFSNQVIEMVAEIPDEKIDTQIKKQIINEAHFLRGYYHLKLILNWEQIIIRDKYIIGQAGLDKATSTRVEAWDFITQEFKEATKLPSKYDTDNIGRATSGAANAYLSFVYLTRAYEESENKTEFLQKSIEAANAVQGYSLEKDFSSMFNSTNKNCDESIFELQFSMSSANGANYHTQFHYWIASSELGGWDEIVPSDLLFDAYKEEGKIASTNRYDERMYQTLFFRDDYYNDGSNRIFGHDYDDLFTKDGVVYDRPVFKKMLPATKEKMDQEYDATNIPLMRYANVLLIKAEALNELNRTEEAIPLINQVRSVHGKMPPMVGTSQAEVRAQIEHERLIEFPLENWRWYDLRRWGKLESSMIKANRTGYDNSKSFYPIPLIEINANSKISK